MGQFRFCPVPDPWRPGGTEGARSPHIKLHVPCCATAVRVARGSVVRKKREKQQHLTEANQKNRAVNHIAMCIKGRAPQRGMSSKGGELCELDHGGQLAARSSGGACRRVMEPGTKDLRLSDVRVPSILVHAQHADLEQEAAQRPPGCHASCILVLFILINLIIVSDAVEGTERH